MTSAKVAERLMGATDWSRLGSANGDGVMVQRAIAELLSSEDAASAQGAYWRIENYAFVQGELFEVSEACASVLVATLADPRARWICVAVLELLFQILSGHASTSPGTPADIAQRCRAAVGEGFWLLVHQTIVGEHEAALDVLDQLGEGARVRALLGPRPD